MLTATDRAQHMAQQVFGWARLNNDKVVTARLVDELMSRDAKTEQGKANRTTVCRILRAQAASEGARVILTETDRYWAIREQLHHMAPADVDALRDDISDGGERDPRAWDKPLIDAIAARQSNRPVPARLWDCKPVAIRLWKDPAPVAEADRVDAYRRRATTVAEESRPGSISEAVKASGLSLGDLVQFPGRTVATDEGREFAPSGYGYLRDAWLSGGQVVAAVEGEDGKRDVPLLSDLRPLRWHMRTVNGGTPERIPTLNALREINAAMMGEGKKAVREMSASGGDARIVYLDVRGEVWLRPATSAEIATEQKPEGKRYAPGDRVIVRGTFYRPEDRRTYVLDEYVGTVVNWAAEHYNVRAVKPDADGATYGVRQCRVRELRPVPPTVDDVVDAPHALYLSGELRHEGVSADQVRRIVKNLRGKRQAFFQDPADQAIVVQNTRYVPQRPAEAPEPAGESEPQVWSEKDIRRARGFAAKWRAETVGAEPPVQAQPTDEALAAAYVMCVKPPKWELYGLIREELAGWDARVMSEDRETLDDLSGPVDDDLMTALGEMYAVVANGTAVPVRADKLVVGMDAVAAVRQENRTVGTIKAYTGPGAPWVRVTWTSRDHGDSVMGDGLVFDPGHHLIVTIASLSRLYAPVSPRDLSDLVEQLRIRASAVPAYLRPELIEAEETVAEAWEALRSAQTPTARDDAHALAKTAAAHARGLVLAAEHARR